MSDLTSRLFNRFDNTVLECEVEEELRFHLEMLTEAYSQDEVLPAEAKAAALKQFGNVERVKDQCVEINRRRRPSVRALTSLLTLIFLMGGFVRIFGTEIHVVHVGDTLIAVGVMGRLFLYVRGLKPSNFRANVENSSPLRLSQESQSLIVRSIVSSDR